jgi:hypothetical protein
VKLARFKFRLLLPLLYVALALLPVIGMIVTIAEGPNPFGFLFFVSEPGLRIFDLIDRWSPLPNLNGWLDMLLVIMLNVGIYFLVGYALDTILNRRCGVRNPGATSTQ